MWLVQQLLGFLLIKLRRQIKNILAVLSKYTVGLNTLSYFNYKQKIWEDVLMVLKKCKKFAEKASMYIYFFLRHHFTSVCIWFLQWIWQPLNEAVLLNKHHIMYYMLLTKRLWHCSGNQTLRSQTKQENAGMWHFIDKTDIVIWTCRKNWLEYSQHSTESKQKDRKLKWELSHCFWYFALFIKFTRRRCHAPGYFIVLTLGITTREAYFFISTQQEE